MEVPSPVRETPVSTQFRKGVDRRNGDRRQGARSGSERRRGDRRGSLARAGLLAAAFALLAHGGQLLKLPLGIVPASAPTQAAQPVPKPKPALSPYDLIIEEASALYGVSADLVRAVIQAESRFNPKAVSRAGARGLMQLTPVTLRQIGGVTDPLDPRQNIFAGVKYLSMMLDRFHGDVPLALAGYNAGPNAVRRHRGIPPYKETRGYVRKIQNMLADSREAARVASAGLAD